MSGHWSDAPPDRRLEQQSVLLDPGYGVLRPLAEVASLAQELDVSNVVRSTIYQRDYMISVIFLSQFLATGWAGAFAFLLNQKVFDFRECVLAFCFFSSCSAVGRIGSHVVFVSGCPGHIKLFCTLRVLFSPFRDTHFFPFWISPRPGQGLLDGFFTGLGIRAATVNEAAFHTNICSDKSLCYVSVDAGPACEIPLETFGAPVFKCDNRTKKRQCRESQSGAPIARKVRGMVALERCRASTCYQYTKSPSSDFGGWQ